MDTATARRALGLPIVHRPAEVEAAFRSRARHLHPDHGGDPAQFRLIVEARDTLLRPPTARMPSGRVVVVADVGVARQLLAPLVRLMARRAVAWQAAARSAGADAALRSARAQAAARARRSDEPPSGSGRVI